MAYRYLGYGITNDKGIAKLEFDANGNPIDHSYTGTGAGELDIIASLDDSSKISDSSIQSETYAVVDGIFKDIAVTGQKSNYWAYQSVWNVTPSPDGTTITDDNTGNPLLVASTENATQWGNVRNLTTPIAVELDVDNIENYPRFIIYYNGDANNEKPVFEQSGHYKFTIGSNGIYRSINGGTPTAISEVAISGTVKIGFSDIASTSQGSLRYKNFVVYPI